MPPIKAAFFCHSILNMKNRKFNGSFYKRGVGGDLDLVAFSWGFLLIFKS